MAKLQRVGTNASPLVAVPRPDAKDEPMLVSEVGFSTWVPGGRVGNPSFKRLRDDKSAPATGAFGRPAAVNRVSPFEHRSLRNSISSMPI